MITGDNDYGAQVWASGHPDVVAPSPLLSALHAELCRPRPHHPDGGFPQCQRALSVMERWQSDGRPTRKKVTT